MRIYVVDETLVIQDSSEIDLEPILEDFREKRIVKIPLELIEPENGLKCV